MRTHASRTRTALVVGLMALLLGCGGGGGGGDEDGGDCGSAWNTQVVLTFEGPPGCPPAGYEEVVCARLWGGYGRDWFILEVDVPSPGCLEDTLLHFSGAVSAGGSMAGVDDQTDYRDCLADALAPGATGLQLENVGGQAEADTFTLEGDWTVFPSLCSGTFTITGTQP